MLSNQSSKPAMIRGINATMMPQGPGMGGSGNVPYVIEADSSGFPGAMLGYISANGPSGSPQYNDSSGRYYVQITLNYQSYNASTSSPPMNLQDAPKIADITGAMQDQIITGYFLPDVEGNTRSLAANTYVLLIPTYPDSPNDPPNIPQALPQIRWMIEVAASPIQEFIVAGLPNNTSGSTMVPCYVIANTVNHFSNGSNGSIGTYNYCIGVTIAHSINDSLYACQPVGGSWLGLNYPTDSSGNYNASGNQSSPVLLQEIGSINNTLFYIRLNQSGGSQGSAGTACSFTYQILTPDNANLLAGFSTPVSVDKPRISYGTMTAANQGTGKIATDGTWHIVEAWEYTTGVACMNASGGSMNASGGS
jgi:hypothetical protein